MNLKKQIESHPTADPLQLASYDYELSQDRIAQFPVTPRDASRLLVVSRDTGAFSDHRFHELPSFLERGDLVVLNNTKVIPARLQSDRGEVLLVRATGESCWDAMVYPGKNFKPGAVVTLDDRVQATVLSQSRIGRILRVEGNVEKLLERRGKMPLPPYIERSARAADQRRYQTIYAKTKGSIAAPTAGLHFTRRTLRALKSRGVQIATLTLHVGPGTFRPVKTHDIRQHHLDPESYRCANKTWLRIGKAKRVIAVGSTTTRALETIARTGELQGYSDLLLYPGQPFLRVQGMITNFHLPKSSLLMMVSGFAGYELIRRAYQHAIDHEYRFYSYGDAMLIL